LHLGLDFGFGHSHSFTSSKTRLEPCHHRADALLMRVTRELPPTHIKDTEMIRAARYTLGHLLTSMSPTQFWDTRAPRATFSGLEISLALAVRMLNRLSILPHKGG
jgi:hypothetical protein